MGGDKSGGLPSYSQLPTNLPTEAVIFEVNVTHVAVLIHNNWGLGGFREV